MERLERSLKAQWMPITRHMTLVEAKQNIGQYLVGYYNWQRPHQYNGGLPPAEAEGNAKQLSEIS